MEDEFYKEIALDIDEDEINVQVTIQYLLSCGLLETSDSIEYKLPFVQDNLGSETASTRRSRKSRENAQKALQCNSGATECNILQQNCNVEIDIEKDIDTDIEKEKENTKESVPASDLEMGIHDQCISKENVVNVCQGSMDGQAFRSYRAEQESRCKADI